MSPSSVGLGRRPAWAPAPICAVPRTAVPPPGDGHGGPERTAGRRGGGLAHSSSVQWVIKGPRDPRGCRVGAAGPRSRLWGSEPRTHGRVRTGSSPDLSSSPWVLDRGRSVTWDRGWDSRPTGLCVSLLWLGSRTLHPSSGSARLRPGRLPVPTPSRSEVVPCLPRDSWASSGTGIEARWWGGDWGSVRTED